MSDGDRAYLPATGRVPLTRAYDAIMALTMREPRWRPAMVDAIVADAGAGGTVVEVGSGTGTLAIAVAKRGATVIAVDPDDQARAIAARKPGADAVDWRAGMADALPLPDQSAGVVVMSLLLHHLPPPAKHAALAEAHRVLEPGGTLHVADWGRPQDPAMHLAFTALQLVDGRAGTSDHRAGRLPATIAAAGFADTTRRQRLRTAAGTLELLRARRQ